MKNLFLCLDIFLFLAPWSFCLDAKAFKLKQLNKAVVPALVTGIIFSAITVVFSIFGIWSFNPEFSVGVFFRGVPLEFYLFCFAFSFLGINVYQYVNARFPKNDLQKFSLTMSNLMLGLCIAFSFFGYTRWYTMVTFVLLFILLFYIEYVNKLRFMYRFYRAFVLCLLPFYICYGIFSKLPIIRYAAHQTLKFNIADIPLESHFYVMSMLLFGVYLFEFFGKKVSK